jgi:small subunit ribosomal protein S7
MHQSLLQSNPFATQSIMPPRLYLFSGRSAALRFNSSHHAAKPALCKPSQQRWITADEKPLPTAEQPKDPNQEQLPHVSEEAAAVDKTMGERGPDLEQGTPVQDVGLLGISIRLIC